jgi:hypothetical protein
MHFSLTYKIKNSHAFFVMSLRDQLQIYEKLIKALNENCRVTLDLLLYFYHELTLLNRVLLKWII